MAPDAARLDDRAMRRGVEIGELVVADGERAPRRRDLGLGEPRVGLEVPADDVDEQQVRDLDDEADERWADLRERVRRILR